MTAVGLPPRRTVRVGVRSSTGIAVGTDEQLLALAGERTAEQSLSVEDDQPRAIAIEQQAQFGMAFQGRRLFTAVGGRQGKQGIQGVPGPTSEALQRLAGETLSALRIVWEDASGSVFALDYRDTASVYLLLGLTVSAAAIGGQLNIQRGGVVDDSAWTWTPGPLWLGPDGTITQSPPVDGFSVLLGSAVSATRVILDINRPIAMG